MVTKIKIHNKRRLWVNNQLSEKTSGTHMSNAKKTRLLRKLWREAKKNIK